MLFISANCLRCRNNIFLSLFLQEQNGTVRVMFAALEQHGSCSVWFRFRSFTSYLLSLCPHRAGRIFSFNYVFFAADWNVTGICIGIVFLCSTLISFSLVWRLKATHLAVDFAERPRANRRGVTVSARMFARVWTRLSGPLIWCALSLMSAPRRAAVGRLSLFVWVRPRLD